MMNHAIKKFIEKVHRNDHKILERRGIEHDNHNRVETEEPNDPRRQNPRQYWRIAPVSCRQRRRRGRHKTDRMRAQFRASEPEHGKNRMWFP